MEVRAQKEMAANFSSNTKIMHEKNVKNTF